VANQSTSQQGAFELDCLSCKAPVVFSILDLDAASHIVSCKSCNKKYAFGEDPLKRQLQKFAALCHQIQDSQEILGDANVAVDVGSQTVQVPFKLLLTRLKSVLNLKVGTNNLCITFRVHPTTLPKS
jgi:transcription elongation factor Elf1